MFYRDQLVNLYFILVCLGDWPDLDTHFGTKKSLRDSQQITLILHNRICLIAKYCCLTPLFLTDNIKLENTNQNQMKIYVRFTVYFSDKIFLF